MCQTYVDSLKEKEKLCSGKKLMIIFMLIFQKIFLDPKHIYVNIKFMLINVKIKYEKLTQNFSVMLIRTYVNFTKNKCKKIT